MTGIGVRCDGRDAAWDTQAGVMRGAAPACGWMAGPLVSVPDPDQPWDGEELASWLASKSCPRCGGRVEVVRP